MGLLQDWSRVGDEGRWPLLVLVLGGIWLHAADTIVVATVIPSVVRELGGLAWTHWAFALYELGAIIAGVVSGSSARRFGLPRAITIALACFSLGCCLSAIAPSMTVFLIGRWAQGMGGGALVALAHVAVTVAWPERQWTRVYALISAFWGLAAVAAPLVGGLFAEAGFWRGAFYAFAAQGFLLLLASPWLLRSAKHEHAPAEDGVKGVPWRSLGTLCIAILSIAIAGVTGNLALGAGLMLAGLAGLLAGLWLDRQEPAPLLPRRALSRPGPARDGLLMILFFSVCLTSFFIYGPLLLGRLYGVGEFTGGLYVALESIAWTVTAIAVGGVAAAGEPRWIRLGAITITLGVAGSGLVIATGPAWLMLPFVAAMGGGFGLCFAFIVRRIVSSVAPEEREHAAGASGTVQPLGYAIGAALAGIVANGMGFDLAAPDSTIADVGRALFWAFLPAAAVALVAAWRLAAAPAKPTAQL